MPAQLTPFVDELPIPPVVNPYAGALGERHFSIKVKARSVHLHRDLPPTPVWSYRLSQGTTERGGCGETYLGPTVVVSRSEVVHARWENRVLPGATGGGVLPFEVVKIDSGDLTAGSVPQNQPGSAGALDSGHDPTRDKLKKLNAALVTHLHGGRVLADSDGWPDNVVMPGQSASYTYHNDQPATMLWYHDHANHVTRLNVYAGLAGVWLIRDDEERALNLPDRDFELPLVLQDRNMALDDTGAFTGAMLHKTEVNGGPGEFFGPYTLVNGKIWPKAEVEPRLYRFRVLNGSNARTWRLMLLDEAGAARHEKAWLIGNDQGLRKNKMSFPPAGLTLAPGERADVLIDFSAFAGHSLYLWNSAEAPFGHDPAYAPDVSAELTALQLDPLAGSPDEDQRQRRPFPQVMRFDVAPDATGPSHLVPSDPLRASSPWSAEITDAMPVRLMALVERPAPDDHETTMLVFAEYMLITATDPAPAGAEVVDFSYVHPSTGQPVTAQFWKAAEEFFDRINWMVHLGSTEQWYIVNLSPDTHPVHVHLVDVQVTQRFDYEVYVNGQASPLLPADGDRTPVIDGTADTVDRIVLRNPIEIESDQTGAKDTVRVDPGEVVGIAMKFAPYAGRFMYHCHILEHEDHDMMRPFIVVDPAVPHHHH